MNLQKFKQTYENIISESTDEREVKNYIRSIVEEILKEETYITTVKGTINDKNFEYKIIPNKDDKAYHKRMIKKYNKHLSPDEVDALVIADPDKEEQTVSIRDKKYMIKSIEDYRSLLGSLEEATSSANDVNTKIENIMAEKGWEITSTSTKYVFQNKKTNRQVTITNDGEDLGWAYGEIGKKSLESGNDPINVGMKEVKRLAGMRVLNPIK